VTLDQVFCLGNCALSPAVLVDGKVHGRVDAARFDHLVSAALATSDTGAA
jgi:formate dehydrogenase subunit gamma